MRPAAKIACLLLTHLLVISTVLDAAPLRWLEGADARASKRAKEAKVAGSAGSDLRPGKTADQGEPCISRQSHQDNWLRVETSGTVGVMATPAAFIARTSKALHAFGQFSGNPRSLQVLHVRLQI